MSNEPFTTQINQIDAEFEAVDLAKLNASHLDVLEKPFTRDEVISAVHQLGPLKALRIDGKPALFYQQY